MTTETETARSKLRDFAEARLSLYVREMGEDFYGKLVANKENWRAGYLPAHNCFAVFPQTAKGDIIVGPFTVVKWSVSEIKAVGFETCGVEAMKHEARSVGFEQWAAA